MAEVMSPLEAATTQAPAEAPEGRLQLLGVRKSFGGRTVVDIDDLALGGHGIEGIIGPNGAGKTTLMNVITRARRPDRGSIVYRPAAGGPVELTGMTLDAIARLGVVKSNQVISEFAGLSVMDSMLLSAAPSRYERMLGTDSLRAERRLREEAREDLAVYVDYFGLRQVDAPALSAGEKKLLDIIRCLLLRPRFLLLDEPTAGLPEDQTRLVMDLMRHKAAEEDVTIVVVEHDLALIWEVCEFVHFMADGRIVEQGPPAAIRASTLVAQKYLGHADG
ncbi:ABC transporter ATP-binding protein [soil metagenome]